MLPIESNAVLERQAGKLTESNRLRWSIHGLLNEGETQSLEIGTLFHHANVVIPDRCFEIFQLRADTSEVEIE